jgi:multimeric flavodoxin WrbA
MKAIALVVSARKRGNCYDFAQFVLDRLQASGTETELVNFHDYQIVPCQRCDYECIQHLDPLKGVDAPCPIADDVRRIWEKTWAAEILLLFIPNYGGLPPALWFAFSQRIQGFYRTAPLEKLKRSVVSAVVLAAPHQSSGAPWILSLLGDEVKGLDRKVAGFEIINPTEFEIEYTFDRLINEQEIQRRLAFLTDRTLTVARDIVSRIEFA